MKSGIFVLFLLDEKERKSGFSLSYSSAVNIGSQHGRRVAFCS